MRNNYNIRLVLLPALVTKQLLVETFFDQNDLGKYNEHTLNIRKALEKIEM